MLPPSTGYREAFLEIAYSSHVSERKKKKILQSILSWDKEDQVNKTRGNWALGKKMVLRHFRYTPASVLFGLLLWGWFHRTVAVTQHLKHIEY